MSNDLKKIVKEIQYKTGKTLDGIATDIGYARAYFTNQVNVGTNKRLKELLLEKYKLGNEQNVTYKKQNDLPLPQVNEDPAIYNKVPVYGDPAFLAGQLYTKEEVLAEKEARRLEAVSRAERAEKEIDRLLTVIEQNLTALQSNSGAIMNQLAKVIRITRSDDGEIMDGQDRLQGLPVGTSSTRAGIVELAHEDEEDNTDKRVDESKSGKSNKSSVRK